VQFWWSYSENSFWARGGWSSSHGWKGMIFGDTDSRLTEAKISLNRGSTTRTDSVGLGIWPARIMIVPVCLCTSRTLQMLQHECSTRIGAHRTLSHGSEGRWSPRYQSCRPNEAYVSLGSGFEDRYRTHRESHGTHVRCKKFDFASRTQIFLCDHQSTYNLLSYLGFCSSILA